MGKDTGFLEWTRVEAAKRPTEARVEDWREFVEVQGPALAHQQAGRCMDCGVPFCHQGCPLGNHIPDWNEHVHRGRYRAAWRALESTNNFPEFTGRLCPAPCEAACVLAVNQSAVTIEQIEKTIVERAFREGWVQPRPPRVRTGRTVAVVGSGPGGLAAAAQLNQAGHSVTVYEKADRLGGLLRYGIPDFKMEKWVIDRRLALMEAEGIAFKTGVTIGESVTWAQLRAQHDALIIAIGASRPRALQVPGVDLQGVMQAMDFLPRQNRRVACDDVSIPMEARDARVVILGGGDTGSDCLGTALRQGARHVRQVEFMPAPPHARLDANPWPQWPMVFRTSSSQAEGGARDFGVLTQRLEGRDGRLTYLHGVQARPNAEGRPEPVPGTEFVWEVDLLIQAMGFVGPDQGALVDELGVALDPRGNVRVDAQMATNVPGVFAVGDAVRGASLIVWAISQGREAAQHADAWLCGAPSGLPSRGDDLAW